ncbi:enoyl-CoA hydratase/isomerase family protein [Parvibaculum sp.]|uniref:enoyl-CoA hydratase/isomerase family protein n=1 Tax=Parvibaculum sp. TaxID=2024848 RepID=UPI00320F2135
MADATAAYETLIIRKEGAVDWVTMNRPDALNSLNPKMISELQDYFLKLYTDQSVRIVVLKGAGRGFCAGLDLKASSIARTDTGDNARGGVVEGLKTQRAISEIVMRMRRCPQAIISLIHGPACGGGFAFALASDIRIAGTSARMNAAFIRIGLSACDIGVSYFLPRLVGVSVASELMMTGRFINAARAERVGLVSEVVPDEKLEEAAQPYIDEMLTTSPIGLRLTKECLNMSVDAGSLEAAIAMEDRNQILCSQTNDMKEGIAAFLQKRKPVFTNS